MYTRSERITMQDDRDRRRNAVQHMVRIT